ncbi:MAG: secondary thiamine-phosphate synthase enzyme YjbQ [Candidatus Nitrosocaldus sp.]|nr:secondary thiamine-phosphate synthase enzyme YjbQ [Candidatus Nitrosocaldus sp.]MDW7999819.1 secondary thiamine-phosphate synthase enzyme YjbQ [Candidatus Nitrosocaldus sp.]
MPIITRVMSIRTKGEGDMLDISEHVSRAVKESGLRSGIVTLFVKGSTAALTTIEYEPGLLKDFPEMLERVAPRGIEYEHEKAWHDGNGHSHVRASLIGPSITIPFVDGRLTLGTWQQVVLIELDVRSRERSVVMQIIGE